VYVMGAPVDNRVEDVDMRVRGEREGILR
jgi:hypothetical protein